MNNSRRSIRMRTCEICGQTLLPLTKLEHFRRKHKAYRFTAKGKTKGIYCGECGEAMRDCLHLVSHYLVCHQDKLAAKDYPHWAIVPTSPQPIPEPPKEEHLSVTVGQMLSAVEQLGADGHDPASVNWATTMVLIGKLVRAWEYEHTSKLEAREISRRLITENRRLKEVAESESQRRARESVEQAKNAMVIHSND